MGRLLVLTIIAFAAATEPVRAESPNDTFEKEIRPLLVEHCQRCHGAEKQRGGLRLDSRDAALKGGDTGPALVSGKPEASLLMSAVRRDGDLKMPPDNPLSAAKVELLRKWIDAGAVWPKDAVAKPTSTDHWAFKPVREPTPPLVSGITQPVDRFIRARLVKEGLTPAARADARTLIRRATYDLTGLPPTMAEVEAFAADHYPTAYAKLIDRLLASPRYGEHWGRHWLDVARYSDTKGYIFAREEKRWIHAWAYRDWVIAAINADMPYDRFVTLQLAADKVSPKDPPSQAAMGFLTLGRRFLGVSHDIIDDRIDVVTRGLLGLTVTCARCHSHKFDPVPTEDYYALYGVFRSSQEKLVPIAEATGHDHEKRYAEEEAKYLQLLGRNKAAASKRARDRFTDYLLAQFELGKYPEEGFDLNLLEDDIYPAYVRRLRDHLKRPDPVFFAWTELVNLDPLKFATAIASWKGLPPEKINPLVRAAFATAPKSRIEVARRYGALFARADSEPQTDPAAEQLRLALHRLCEVPAGMLCDIDPFFPTLEIEDLWKQRRQIDRVLIESPTAPAHALVLVDRPEPVTAAVFRRGNPATPGEDVPRRFLTVLGGRKYDSDSGRLELAKDIVNPANPLTARVFVNRVWQHHFSHGLVPTTSDFGTRADPPSHPELLDWLAADFVKHGWSLKRLHRTMMLSETYQQAAAAPSAKDPENRWLSHMAPRRLTFEELRDTLYAVTDDLDAKVGGRPVPLFSRPFTKRRTVYGEIDREYLPSLLRIFDFANPDLHTPLRSDTTVPQQSLFFLNHPLPLDRARALAAKVQGSDRARVAQMVRRAYQREPTPRQIEQALAFVAAVAMEKVLPANDPWSYGYGELVEGKVKGFKAFATYTGDAWQPGAIWPDPALGWMKLTSDGGHAGEKHLVIRRWTSPVNGTVSIGSKLQHKSRVGDGVRGVIVSSRAGKLASGDAAKSTVELNAKSVEVREGDTIDFVIDSRASIQNDEFLWSPVIRHVMTEWGARKQFRSPEPPLTAWEQLAQVLLMANEFSFID